MGHFGRDKTYAMFVHTLLLAKDEPRRGATCHNDALHAFKLSPLLILMVYTLLYQFHMFLGPT